MKVCIDIQSAVTQRAGVGRYTRALVEHLGMFREKDSVELFYFDFKRHGLSFTTPDMEQRSVLWIPGRIVQKSWKTLSWPPFNWFAGSSDVYHFPNFIIPPLTSGKTVVTIHDVSFLRFPDFAERKNLAYLTARIKETIARADAIITDSQFSAGEITELLSVDPGKLVPIHLGVENCFQPPSDEQISRLRKSKGLLRPYILTVGTLEPRKNISFLIDVFERMTRFEGDLVVAGMKGWKYQLILERMLKSNRSSNIHYLEYVKDEELPVLYGGAELFIFPSVYEGFGFPPLESMKCRTPVVSSSTGSLPEILGDAAVLMDDYDADKWADEAMRLIEDTSTRELLIEKAYRHAAKYDWKQTAGKTWDVYRRVSE